MERLLERMKLAYMAFAKFQEVMMIEQPSVIERDAAMQRFEFTFEALWKAAKQFLFDEEGIDLGSPKGVIRACREIGLLDEVDALRALQMADDRNLTVHTYNESLAIEIFERMSGYERLMQAWLDAMKVRMDEILK